MPTSDGRFKGISLTGKAGEAWDRLFARKCLSCGAVLTKWNDCGGDCVECVREADDWMMGRST